MGMNSHQNQTTNGQPDERGFASIVIALILIIILSLLTIGFAQLARREQQSALDKQLASQAYYAAESGINDAYSDITTIDSTTGLPYINSTNASATTCMTTNPPAKTANPDISSTTGVVYSCLLVDLQPPDIKYDNIAAQSNRYTTFSTDTPAASFTIHWGSTGAGTVFPANTATGFLPLGTSATPGTWTANKYPAVLQVSITPLNSVDRNSLINNTFTVYLYPASSGLNTVTYSPLSTPGNKEGAVVPGNCSVATNGAAYPCQVTIKGLNGTGTGPYLIHVIDYYDDSNVNIDGNSSNAGAPPLQFIDGQAQIDVTGKAKDVLKRLQVRVPIHPNAPTPNYAVEGQNVCKRFSTFPTGTTPDTLPGCDLN